MRDTLPDSSGAPFPRAEAGEHARDPRPAARRDEGSLWPSTRARLSDDLLACIAGDAEQADARGSLAGATIDRLRQARYFGLPVPATFEGGGAGLLECAAIQRQLGMADPALAIALNMHLFSVGMTTHHWQRRRDACGMVLEVIASQNRIVASAFAEPGLGGTLLRSNAKARPVAGGYRVTGTKSPCSLAAHCDLVCFQAEIEPSEPEGLIVALVPAKSAGVRVERTWDALGMRGSASDTLLLEDCFVPRELVCHRCAPGADDDEVFAAGVVWFCLTTTATYLGVASAAVDCAASALHKSPLNYLHAPRAALPSVQSHLGDSVAPALALEASCIALATRLDEGTCDARALVPYAVALKHVAVDACIRAVEQSAELAGGASYARRATLARLWRDVQALRFHPPTRLVSRQLLGRWALGLPYSLELDERPVPSALEEAASQLPRSGRGIA